jgi:hypothetical protein
MIDLAVAYRIYPGFKAPAFYPTDKFKLSEMCLSSFQRALGRLRVKVYAILDGCPPEYVDLFRMTLKDRDVEIIQTDRIGNQATFSLQIDLLRKQTEAENVYFAEDDYFYFPEALEKMVSFMRENRDVDFVTPYDHPDSYYTSSRYERHLVKPWGDRYWRTASSSCLTFLTSRRVLQSTASMFNSYRKGNMDCPIWLSLTQKLSLFDPRIHLADLPRFKFWIRTWQFGLRRVMFGRHYKLWVSMPTLSTHMESKCLSPLVDWQEEFQRFSDASEQSG